MDECGVWDERSWWSMWDVYVFGSGRRGWRGGEWMRELGLGATNHVRTRGVLEVCLCLGCSDVVGVGGEWIWKGGVVLCLCELWVRIICVDGRSRYLYIVLGGYLRILCAPIVQLCSPYGYLLPTMYLCMADIVNPYLFVCGYRTSICLDITRFYEDHR